VSTEKIEALIREWGTRCKETLDGVVHDRLKGMGAGFGIAVRELREIIGE